ncbi:MAG: DUF393 domain-containing protein [bacterium]|nr:DUF393 domain-containing protein [bacterium]
MSNIHLADPDERPQADVVIWDGKCNFCRKQVERLHWFDRQHQLAYLSLHDPRVAARWPNLSYEELMKQIWVIAPDDEQYGGADAGRYLSRRLKSLWWLMPLLHIPFSMPLWRWIYSKVAARRYRIAGMHCDEGGTCDLHR